MRVRRGLRPAGDKIELNMTPMIDIVFQLLTFFIMSLRIAATEGDFQVGLPQASPRVDVEARDTHRFRLRLTAAPDGSLRAMRLDEQTLATGVASAAEAEAAFAALHREVLAGLRSVVRFFHDASRDDAASPAYLQLQRAIAGVQAVLDELEGEAK